MADDRRREIERQWREGMTEEERSRWARSLYDQRRGHGQEGPQQERFGQESSRNEYGDYARHPGEHGYTGGYGRQASGAYGQPEGGRGFEQGYGGAAEWNRGWAGQGDTGRDIGRSPAGYAGRGPKGYRRSDDRVREDVCDRLTDDPQVDASNIEVTVKDCEVTLNGTVDSRAAKRRAEDCAENVPGVRNVQNGLRIQQGTTSENSATGTAAAGTRASGSSTVRS